jgi:hypothetical protein
VRPPLGGAVIFLQPLGGLTDNVAGMMVFITLILVIIFLMLEAFADQGI